MIKEDRAVFEAILEAQQAGHPAALATIIKTEGSVPRLAGSKLLVRTDGRLVGTVGGGEVEAAVIEAARSALHDGKTRLLSYNLADLQAGDPSMQGGSVDVFIEPLLPPPTVLVVGCGHVGKAVAELAKWMDFRVIVSDDRPGYATPEQIPGMDGYVEAAPAELTQHVTIDHVTCVAAITRGVIVDQDLLPPLLATDAPYIGVIGGRRRWLLTSKTLQEAGISPETLMRVRTPVGLDLGGETPKEIALSILAEIVMVLRNGTGQPLKSQ